ncbi:MAG: D-alanyl-D-alanine carboxypeptidase family protein [Gammaproteobacteria bacterium]|nr:D-alanyl-D-alanine carboxypeptidase family protein [Gammaproteobacteria bacterium]MDG1951541.1 D-alanyl-D-alanine carboxypeptidase family protein [Gammaproteobacteria bacterium]
MLNEDYLQRIKSLHAALGIDDSHLGSCGMPLCHVPVALVEAGEDIYGRPQLLTRETFESWKKMCQQAALDGVLLQLVSGFRDLDYQAEIIRRKLDRGQALNEILKINAAPGFSEHHTGRAIDLTSPGGLALQEKFEESCAFKWLINNAVSFGFNMSYPRNNQAGIAYEPWHWCYDGHRRDLSSE